ncbi:MAG: Glutamyl-Q tRNA(Asp) synthetase [Porticoccaceae bacterium UBA1117]|nr:MAG: Glutamyl-Q tRNA(Asp) synthetase [Porticoccaceae bacterium UBA1117]
MAYEMAHEKIVGRFAPSPSGPLHFGSLACALASYLDVKVRQGQWLVRMEDLDPPREIKGASRHILNQLEAHGLHWDGEVLYQSHRLEAYAAAVSFLKDNQLAYHCQCNRKRVAELDGTYDNRCRNLGLDGQKNATRLALREQVGNISFDDQVMGHVMQNMHLTVGDFIIQRRDELFSYQLAVTVDDAFQKVTRVMRGSDLLDSTPRQICLQQCLGYHQPSYAHVPIAVTSDGQKLSKQNLATGLLAGNESSNLWAALDWLQQSPPKSLSSLPAAEIITWATQNWDQSKLQAHLTAPAPKGF